jgi:hypothetical protein
MVFTHRLSHVSLISGKSHDCYCTICVDIRSVFFLCDLLWKNTYDSFMYILVAISTMLSLCGLSFYPLISYLLLTHPGLMSVSDSVFRPRPVFLCPCQGSSQCPRRTSTRTKTRKLNLVKFHDLITAPSLRSGRLKSS